MIGEVQILGPEELARHEAEAQRRGHHIDFQLVIEGVDDVFAVRTFATLDDLEEAKSRLYLGLPLVRD